MNKTRIIVVDDHKMFCDTLQLYTENDRELTVTASCHTAEDAIKYIDAIPAEVVLLDITLGDQEHGGIDLADIIKREYPHLKILMLSMHNDLTYITNSFLAGAHGYVNKASNLQIIKDAIKQVMSGYYYIDSNSSDCIARFLIEENKKKKMKKDTRFSKLSSREKEVLKGMVQGYKPSEISEKLYISTKTVSNHIFNIKKKLNMESKAQIIQAMNEAGITDLE